MYVRDVLTTFLAVFAFTFYGVFGDNSNNRSLNVKNFGYEDVIGCIKLRDARCLLDVAQNIVEREKRSLLAEVDRIYLEASGRSDEEEGNAAPTQISHTLGEILTELSEIVKDGIGGFFRDTKDEEDDDEDEDEDEETSTEETGEGDEEENKDSKKLAARGHKHKEKKKKIWKLINKIKLLIAGGVLAVTLFLGLALMNTHLQVKFVLIALFSVIINAAKFYLDVKKGHPPQKVIYYQHAHHQHHHDDVVEDEYPHEEGYWARRNYDEGAKTAHDLAYIRQKPTVDFDDYTEDKGASSSSWFG